MELQEEEVECVRVAVEAASACKAYSAGGCKKTQLSEDKLTTEESWMRSS